MIDKDLAELYGVENKRLNEQVKRNIDRFPENFRFQLNSEETKELVANCDRFNSLKHSSSFPHVFTEQGVAMLSAVLHSKVAISVSISIINAFVKLRSQKHEFESLLYRVANLEKFQLETQDTFEKVFLALEPAINPPQYGIFFENQLYDAHLLTIKILNRAKFRIRLIDNYVDETVLELFSSCNKPPEIYIYCHQISKPMNIAAQKFQSQYGNLSIHIIKNVHDRFLIIDDIELYHFGASLKDLGKKWFAFSRMDSFVKQVLTKLPF